jgi:hypothetical protein
LPSTVLDDRGSIPLAALPIINAAILFTTMLVYAGAVLVQYGRGGAHGQ